MKIESGYEPLAGVLQDALDQAQYGKGKKCHANGKPFLEQPIMTGGRECGPGGLLFQARKKLLEAVNCEDDGRAIEDLLGAINYTAALVLLRREKAQKDVIAELKKSAAQLSPGIIVRRGVSTVPLTEGMTMKESAEYFVEQTLRREEILRDFAAKTSRTLDEINEFLRAAPVEQEQTLRREAPGRSGYQGIAMVIDPAGKEPSWFVRGDVAVKCGSSFTLPPVEQYCDEAEPAQEPACPHANTKDIDPAKSYGYTKFCTDCGEPLDRVGYCPTTPTAGRLA